MIISFGLDISVEVLSTVLCMLLCEGLLGRRGLLPVILCRPAIHSGFFLNFGEL